MFDTYFDCGKYVTDLHSTAEDAVREGFNTSVDLHSLTRCIVKGSWRDASTWLTACNPDEAKSIRNKLMAYLGTILLNDDNISDRNQACSDAIKELSRVNYISDNTQLAIISAVVFDVIRKFKEYPR